MVGSCSRHATDTGTDSGSFPAGLTREERALSMRRIVGHRTQRGLLIASVLPATGDELRCERVVCKPEFRVVILCDYHSKTVAVWTISSPVSIFRGWKKPGTVC